MQDRESERVEWKEIVTEDIKKEIIAFANTDGGTIYIGRTDSGMAIGVENVDFTIQQISNMVRDSIRPDVTLFLHYSTEEVQGKTLVVVTVQRGTGRPYYLAKKGMRPEGVYVRQGTSSVPATETGIRHMIKATDGERYEAMRSLEQELTFTAAQSAFQARNLPLDTPQMKTLGILNQQGIYTNLALLLSDQCPHTMKMAVFAGLGQNDFQDRRDLSGSLLEQMNQAYAYIDLNNRTHATFQGLLRTDQRAYPEQALREALLNAIVHREYSFPASTLISIYSDRIEFLSVGGLPDGITLEDVMLGLSVCRNQQLANLFYRLKLIEAYGTGMKKIWEAYQGTGQTPTVKVTAHGFLLILPNSQNLQAEKKAPQRFQALGEKEKENQVLALAKEQGSVGRQEVEALLRISQASSNRLLRQMQRTGQLKQAGAGRFTRYAVPSTPGQGTGQ